MIISVKNKVNMSICYSVKLASCVKGEKIKFVFGGLQKLYLAVLSEEDFEKYRKNVRSVKRILCSSNAIRQIPYDGVWYAVVDNDGTPFNVQAQVIRYSPFITDDEILENKKLNGQSFVLNAKDTKTDGSMIQYWKDNQHKDSKINLNNKTFVCPSCGKRVNIDSLHGAHVVKAVNLKGKLYITPTCDSCNTSKTNRIFKVDDVDLIEAPKD